MSQRSSWASHAIWGSIATCAVIAASVTIALVVGNHRGIEFASVLKRSAPAPVADRAPEPVSQQPAVIAAPSIKDHEIARLNDALRALSAERDRLEERLAKLEQSLGDITASINSRPQLPAPQATAPSGPRIVEQAAEPKPPPRVAAAPAQPLPPETGPHGVPAAGAIEAPGGEVFLRYVTAKPLVAPPSATQAPMQIHASPLARDQNNSAPQESSATRTEFGVDLGGEPTMNALRARWTNLRTGHAPVIGNLRPLVSVRDGARPGNVELRLIAGPLANAGEAARICASLQTKGVNCVTAVYDGQRLALR
ncbi:MAG TPA: hypothetical protein VFY21_14850 [Xanthobacteraceae bacterium]|nr:hypothetical protein [Xanthobacteraceae bacterium]